MSALPAVCFLEDVCQALRLSSRTVKRLLRAGVFPVPELPRLDRRHRWSGAAITAFIESGANQFVAGRLNHGRTLRAVPISRKGNSIAPLARSAR